MWISRLKEEKAPDLAPKGILWTQRSNQERQYIVHVTDISRERGDKPVKEITAGRRCSGLHPPPRQ
jgi:hypothetical protein